MNDILKIGMETIEKEIEALQILKKRMGGSFTQAADLLFRCKGKVVITGMGKSGLIGQKIAATMTSTGTPAFFLDPAEGSHGDLGLVLREDVVIALSKSGETDEIVKILPYFKRYDVKLITITSAPESVLAKNSDVVLDLGVVEEACPLNLAPTSSTTAQLVLGDALAVALLKMNNFTEEDFALLHPGGLLHKQLLKVSDLMHTGADLPLVDEDEKMKNVISVIIDKKFGVAIVVDKKGRMQGILVDGDLKRILLKTEDIMERPVKEFMVRDPKTVKADDLVAKALKIMEGQITSLVIRDEQERPKGLIHIHDILKSGIY
ncbi:MAG: KpsF/GutQ family sugar-phosphate isomerase [bacterium]|nr:KpsF/GutQ family sugar-phosphate isomerase [bacterium]